MVPAALPPTKLLIIGGAEDRVGKAKILKRFVKLAGGRAARIVIIPTASSFQDVSRRTIRRARGSSTRPRASS